MKAGGSIIQAELKQDRTAVMGFAVEGRGYAAPKRKALRLDGHSGTVVLDLPAIAPGDRFEPAAVKVTGATFYGKLEDYAGLAVREAPQTVHSDGAWGNPSGGETGFILDFGGMRSVLGLARLSGDFKFTLVLPWLGTDFGPASLFPSYPGNTPQRGPSADGAFGVSLRGAETQKLYVQIRGDLSAEAFAAACALESLAFPANLRASVADRPPFWTHPGPLQGETSMQGLSEALTSLAADLKAPLSPKLTIQSDAPGVLEVPGGFGFLQAEKGAAASWAGSPATSIPLRAGVPGTLPLRFPAPQDGKTWSLRSLRMAAHATLDPWIFEPVGTDPAGSPASLRIDARLSACQGFRPAAPVELHGVGLLLAAAADAEISVELCADESGRPATGPALAVRMLSLAGAAEWREALFEKPIALEAGALAWIVLKAKSGTALWSAAPAYAGIAAQYAEDGTAWQPFPRMLPAPVPGAAPPPGPKPTPVDHPAAGLRLFRTPRPEENQARVILSHANGGALVEMPLPVGDEAVEAEWLWPASGRPELAPGPDRGLELGLRSLSGGVLDIASASVFFAWKGA
jgi:hypothetical protein